MRRPERSSEAWPPLTGGLGAVVAAMALSVAVFGWSSPQASSLADDPGRGAAEVFDPSFSLDPDAYEEAMSELRPALSRSPDGERGFIGNCRAFLVAQQAWDRRTELMRDPNVGHYRNCLPLRLIHTGRAPTWHLARGDRLGQALLDRLDPRQTGTATPSWFAGAGRLADVPAERLVGEHRVDLRRDGETWSIEAVASLDLLDKGVENLLARVAWRDEVTYVIVRPKPSGALVSVLADIVAAPLGVASAR